MIINSQFFISHYTGKESLDLMSMPSGFEEDNIKKAEYNRFIQSIDTIYASQNLNGEVPKFWTRRTQIIDDFGNVSYTNEPHPLSTLTSLSSMSSYYFILRDSTEVPVKIPVKGGEVFGFTDSSSLPIVDSVSSCLSTVSSDESCSQIKLTSNNFTDVIFNISNLRPYESYFYEISSISANWPVDINPVSGIIKPAKATGVIEINALFCPSTGICGSNILDYTLSNECLLTDPNKVYATIQLSIKPTTQPDLEVYSDHFSVFCEDCLPSRPTVSISGSESDLVDGNTFDGFAYYNFDLVIAETGILNNDKNYTYQIETLSAEWPFIFITPTGGIATINSGSKEISINNQFFICPATGLCPPGTPGVPTYSIPNYPKFLLGEEIVAERSSIKIRASIESYDCPGQKVYSNTRTITFIR
jgi:hypothetical protein